MWRLLMKDFIDICFIGDGSHATRIKQTLSDLSIKFNLVTFDRNKAISSQPEVINCQVIFITSPNDTHADYLADLNKIFNGYIYCEKPPCSSLEEVNNLYLMNHKDKERIYFNSAEDSPSEKLQDFKVSQMNTCSLDLLPQKQHL